MDEPKRRRGPLLWIADLVRHRPVEAALLGLLLIMSVALSVTVALLIARNGQAEQAQKAALQAQERATILGDRLKFGRQQKTQQQSSP
jgi:hypothetical protein